MSISKTLADARIKKGLTYRDISRETGLSLAAVFDLINGKTPSPTFQSVCLIGNALGLSPKKIVDAFLDGAWDV